MTDIDKTRLIKVLMLPDYRKANPYQILLCDAVTNHQVQVNFPTGYRRVLPIYRATRDLLQPPDLIHIHWLGPYIKGKDKATKIVYGLKFLWDIASVKKSKINLIWTIHNRVSHDATFPKFEMWIQRRLARLVDGIILHNQATAEDISQEVGFSLSKARVIPIGHYRSVYQPLLDSSQARKILGLPQNGRMYFHLGLLRRYKGIDRLIKVWKDNQHLFAGDILFIAGKAEDPIYAQELQELAVGAQGIQIIAKYIADQDLHLYYSAADVMVFPFTAVLNSSSVITAMSYDKPVIAPKLGGITETVGEAGDLLYDSKDSQGLLNALKRSYQIDLQELAERTSKACDKLDWQIIGKNTAELYRKVFSIT